MSSANGHYPFSYEYQRNVLGCLFSLQFLKYNRGVLKWEHFSDVTCATVADEVLRYYDKWKKVPTKGALQEALRRTLKGRARPTLADCRRVVTAALSDTPNTEEVGASVREFAATAATLPLLVDFKEAVDRGEIDRWEADLTTALKIRHPPPALTHYDEDIAERLRSYKTGAIKVDPIPTGIGAIDHALGGGLGRQELGVLIGLSGVGKSQMMVHIGASAVEKGRKVFHYCCEMRKTELLARYDRRFTGMYEKDMAKKYKRLSKVMAGKPLMIAHFPEGVLTAGMIQADFDKLGPPDLLIVDYPVLMKVTGVTDVKFTRFAIERNYMEVRSVGMEYNCAVWAPFQSNRIGHETEASDGDHITRKHSAEAYGVHKHADVFASLNQTSQEEEEGKARFYVDKNRSGKGNLSIPIKVDWSRSIVR